MPTIYTIPAPSSISSVTNLKVIPRLTTEERRQLCGDVSDLALSYLDSNKSLTHQDQDAMAKAMRKCTEQFPFLSRYEDSWPLRVRLRAMLKRSSYLARHMQAFEHRPSARKAYESRPSEQQGYEPRPSRRLEAPSRPMARHENAPNVRRIVIRSLPKSSQRPVMTMREASVSQDDFQRSDALMVVQPAGLPGWDYNGGPDALTPPSSTGGQHWNPRNKTVL
ncbi:hypothetical protein BDW22DRAFT_1221236 [Trametopsis cervina]|nr:hypothetical protein BDW22DRAFT_1221236 [Trametopsis cervina]